MKHLELLSKLRDANDALTQEATDQDLGEISFTSCRLEIEMMTSTLDFLENEEDNRRRIRQDP